jgi:glycine amidinotransferase
MNVFSLYTNYRKQKASNTLRKSSKADKGSQTEYNQLSKVIIGRIDAGNSFPTNDLGMLASIAADNELFTEDNQLDLAAARQLVPTITDEIIAKTNSELETLVRFFTREGVTVVRPEAVAPQQQIATKNYTTTQFPVYCPRDIIFNFRDLIIISPNLYQSRQQEADYYHDILTQERNAGRIVIEAPRPRLLPKDFDLSRGAESILHTNQPVFEAANALIDGEHNAIYYQISNSGNWAGYEWLQGVIGAIYPEVTVYPLRVYNGSHLDTTIAILDYHTVALNPERIKNLNDLPDPLRKRKHIYPDLLEIRNPGALSSMWIGMNSVSINAKLVVVDGRQTRYIKQLQNHGFDVFPHTLTYSDVIEGGHHCTTSDLRRIENY